MVFNAQGYAVDNGVYWNGSYVPGSSSATWQYHGDVSVIAEWRRILRRNVPNASSPKGNANLFAPGELAGTFADGDGTFALTLDEGLKTAYFAAWTTDGDILSECEAEVADGTLVLTTEAGEVYRLAWEGGSLVATHVE